MMETVIIFGGTGHLATRRLIPSLAYTSASGSEIIAVGRRELSHEEYISLLTVPTEMEPQEWEKFTKRIKYIQADPTGSAGYLELSEQLGLGDRLAYMALPPDAVEAALIALLAANIHKPKDGSFSIVLEKPFGVDTESAQALKKRLSAIPEESVFTIDHYLAKETVGNLLAFRFGNALFEPLWNKDSIKEIQITVAETEGVEDRLSTYATLGAGRDQLQSHILQLIALMCMEEPVNWTSEAITKEKCDLLSHVVGSPEKVIRGRYTMQEGLEEELKGQETFVAASLSIDTERWRGVPLSVRTGKKLKARVTDVTVIFKPAASALFGTGAHQNSLTFRIQPDESIFMSLAIRNPEKMGQLSVARMTFCYHDTFTKKLSDSYIRVLQAVLSGDRTVVVDAQEIAESWRVVDSLLLKDAPIHEYEPGSWGPEEATDILPERCEWQITEGDVCNGVTLMP